MAEGMENAKTLKPITYTIPFKNGPKNEKSSKKIPFDGSILHPSLGILPTKFFQHDVNVHYFYDYGFNVWIPMTLEVESLQTTASSMTDSVRKYLKETIDRRDILMMLRTCNYNKTKCIHTINSLLEDKHASWHVYPITKTKAHKEDTESEPRCKYSRETTQFFGTNKKEQHPLGKLFIADQDDIIFELFQHESGKQFDCIIRQGERFYFNDLTKSFANIDNGWIDTDARQSILWHPLQGKLHTNLQQKPGQTVHCYYDNSVCHWQPLPIGWELKHQYISKQIDYIRFRLPAGGNIIEDHKILCALRTCNYQQHDTVSLLIYMDNFNKVSMTLGRQKQASTSTFMNIGKLSNPPNLI